MELRKKRIQQVLVWGLFVETILVTPWSNFDSINIGRMLFLITLGSILFFLLIPNFTKTLTTKLKVTVYVLVAFFIQMLLVVCFAPGFVWQSIFGINGRHTGFLTYSSLIVVLFSAAVTSSKSLLKSVVNTMTAAGILCILYSLIQYLGEDPISWTNPYSPVFGFFGNPNLLSAYMGFSAAAITTFIFSREVPLKWKALSSTYVVSALWVIHVSRSVQGLLVYGFGFATIVTVFFYKTKKFKKFGHLVAIISVVLTTTILLDILQKGFWNSFLYKPSVSYRGDYWRAGWSMTLDHPFFGVGFDSYRDWYFRHRDLATVTRTGSNKFTDSSHNIFLDLSSNGGIPLLLCYLAINLLVVIAIFRFLRRSEKFDHYFVSILVVWVGYTAQSFISINHISLALWGWVISGLLLGYELNTRPEQNYPKNSKPELSVKGTRLSVPVKASSGLLVGLLLGLPPFLADVNFRSSLDSGRIEKLEASVVKWPQDPVRMYFVANLFYQNNLESQSLEVTRNALGHFPNSYLLWKMIYDLPNSSAKEKAQALKMMKELNPFDPELKAP